MPTTASLTEVALLVHFQAPLNLTVLDIADWAGAFNEYPVLQQTPPSPFINLAAMGPPQVVVEVVGELTPRVILRSASIPFIVQLQNDRFGFSWGRNATIGAPEEYPGFISLFRKMNEHLDRFEDWHARRFGSGPLVRLIEIIYTNSLPVEKASGESRRLSEVFKYMTPGGRPVNGFGANWVEFLEPRPDGPRVSANIGVGMAVQTQIIAPPVNVLFYNFNAVAQLPGVRIRDSSISDMAMRLHDRVLEMYRASITSESQ